MTIISPKLINSFPTEQLTIFSDLTGTLVRQNANGMSDSTRKSLTKLINGNGQLIVVTNDSLDAAHKYFISQLGPVNNSYFLITGGGYQGHQVLAQEIKSIFIGRPISIDIRRQLQYRFAELLAEKFSITHAEVQRWVDFEIERCSIAALNNDFGELSFLESVNSKVAIFFLDSEMASDFQNEIFTELECDETVKRLVDKDSLYITRGANFLDITSCIKSDGITQLLSNKKFSHNLISRRKVVVMGDSVNDKSLLTYPFVSQQMLDRVFLGKDKYLITELQAYFPRELRLLEGSYVAGAEEYLKSLVADDD